MRFEACDKHRAQLRVTPRLRAPTDTRGDARGSTPTPCFFWGGGGVLSQHVQINLLRAICQEIFSLKQPGASRDEALPGCGRLTNSCLYASQRVNKDYEDELLSLQTHRPVTHLNG